MTIVNWAASDTASWIFFGVGVLSAVLAIPGTAYSAAYTRRRLRIRSFLAWFPTLMGLLLMLAGAVLVGMEAGRLSWLSILSGAACLLVFAFRRLELRFRYLERGFRRLDEVNSRINRHLVVDEMELPTAALYLSGPARYPSPRTIADAIYEKLDENGKLLSPQSFAADVSRSIAHEGIGSGSSLSAIIEEAYRNLVEKGVLPSASEIADGVFWTRHVKGAPAVEPLFDDLATSMVDTGRWAPVSVYTSADDGAGVKDAVVAVLREFGLKSAVEEPPVQGSWFQHFWARSREVAGSKPVRERLAKLERAIELEGLGKRQAEIDKAKAESVAALYGIMKEQENAVVRMGSIIMIKTEGDLVVWTIGEMEAASLERTANCCETRWRR